MKNKSRRKISLNLNEKEQELLLALIELELEKYELAYYKVNKKPKEYDLLKVIQNNFHNLKVA